MIPKCVLILSGFFVLSIYGVHVELDPRYHVNWEVSEDRTEVTFEVIAKTTGYVGLGLSSNGAMTKADIFIGGVKDGTPYFNDYHGPDLLNGMPIVDAINNYNLISASENATHTTLKFSRLVETCDKEDMAITDAGLRLIWAIGTSDDLVHHGQNRNTKSVYILDPAIPNPDLSHLKHFDITSKIPMAPKTTNYWCSIRRLPDIEPKEQQMIAYEPIFVSPEARNFTHHMNVLKCFHGLDPDRAYGDWVDHPGTEYSDYSSAPGFPGDGCIFLEYGWALGGELAVNPPDVGFPFNSRTYYLLEVHLNNPNHIPNIETNPRKIIDGRSSIKPFADGATKLFGIYYNCTLHGKMPQFPNFPEGIRNYSQNLVHFIIKSNRIKEGIKAYNAFLHAHTSARKMRIRHFRDGVELPWIINDENYDFNYQTNRRLPKEVTILAGDQITAECEYDTNWNGGLAVLGGSSTDDEMCMVFIAYHPAVEDMEGCYDWMNKFNMFNMLGVERVDNPTGKNPYVTAPEGLAGMRFSEVVNKFNWTAEARRLYQYEQQYGDHVTACVSPRLNIVEGYYPTVEKYKPKDICEAAETSTPKPSNSTTAILPNYLALLFTLMLYFLSH